jgi:hypothetical protein
MARVQRLAGLEKCKAMRSARVSDVETREGDERAARRPELSWDLDPRDRAVVWAAAGGEDPVRVYWVPMPNNALIVMEIEQLTARGGMDASALYEPPFSNIHGGGPDELFSGRENVIEGIFKKLEEVNSGVTSKAS